MFDFINVISGSFVKIIQDSLIFFFHLGESFGIVSYGLAIILFTIAVKLLLLPLTLKQIKSTQLMQEMQPRMKAIQEKYKNDKEKLQQEMMHFYKETGFNPLAGCLPLLVQMPILIGIFWALRDFDYAATPFLWVPNLGLPDPTYILPVISALATFVQTYQTIPDTSGQNKYMLFGMPLFIGYISIQFPAGVVLYWTVTNILQVIQQACFSYKRKKAKKIA